MIGRTNASGGGASLNFKVVGNPKPETAAENTIWLNVDAITGWEIAPALPEAMTEGMAWIEAGNSGEICFNALKKNAILIFPLSAKQYSGGTWVNVEAQIYQDGAWKDWVDWSKWIVKNGIYKLPMVAEGKPYDSSFSPTTFTVTEVDGGIQFSHGGGTGMVYWGPVDLTNATKLTIEGDFRGKNSSYPTDYMLAVWKSIGSQINNFEAMKQLTDTGAELDVSSLTGQCYVGFTVRNTGYEIVRNLYVE